MENETNTGTIDETIVKRSAYPYGRPKVPKNSRKAMAEYLGNHYRYVMRRTKDPTKGQPTSYANCMGLDCLNLPKTVVKDQAAMALLDDVCLCRVPFPEWDEFMAWKRNAFLDEWQWYVGANGEHGDHLVLYPIAYKKGSTTDYSVDATKPVDESRDYGSWGMDELRGRTKLVEAFDALCNELRNGFLELARQATLYEYHVSKRKTERILLTDHKVRTKDGLPYAELEGRDGLTALRPAYRIAGL